MKLLTEYQEKTRVDEAIFSQLDLHSKGLQADLDSLRSTLISKDDTIAKLSSRVEEMQQKSDAANARCAALELELREERTAAQKARTDRETAERKCIALQHEKEQATVGMEELQIQYNFLAQKTSSRRGSFGSGNKENVPCRKGLLLATKGKKSVPRMVTSETRRPGLKVSRLFN